MRTERFRRGLGLILLVSAIMLSMTFTAPPVLATGVVEEPGGTTIEVDGLTGTFVVTLPASSPIVQPLAITGGIVLSAGILIIWLRRRRMGGNG